MNQIKHRNYGNEGMGRDRGHRNNRPYWKRAHHDWRFWVGLVLMSVAITIYVMSDNLALLPSAQPQQPASSAIAK